MEDANEANGQVDPGISLRFGPVKSEDVQMEDAEADGNALGPSKRKSRASTSQKMSYAEPESSEEEDKPLVRYALHANPPTLPPFATLLAVAVGFNG